MRTMPWMMAAMCLTGCEIEVKHTDDGKDGDFPDADTDTDSDTDTDADTDTDSDTDTDADTDTGADTGDTGEEPLADPDGTMDFDILVTLYNGAWWEGEPVETATYMDEETGESVTFGHDFTLLFIDSVDYRLTGGEDPTYYCKLTYDVYMSVAYDMSEISPWPGWDGAGWDFNTATGFYGIEGNCLDISSAMGWSDINLVNYMSWGHVLGPMDDVEFKEALEEAYEDYADWIGNAGIEWVMVTTTSGDLLFPLNYFFTYEIDSEGTVLDSEPMLGTGEAEEMPNGLYITHTHFGLRFTTAEEEEEEEEEEEDTGAVEDIESK